MAEKTSEWLLQRSVEICKKMDNSDDLPWKEKEQLLREAEEIAGRMSSDLRSIECEIDAENSIMERLDKITARRIKEGLEDG
jgi:hypothetical protein